MNTRTAISGVVLVATLAVTGCGGEDTEKTPSPGAVVERYYASTQDPAAQCATLSRGSLAEFGSGGRAACQKRTIASTTKSRGAKTEKELVTGDTACVRFQVVGGGKGIATLVKENAQWKLNGFHSGAEPTKSAARKCGSREAEEEFERSVGLEEKGGEGESEREREREREREEEMP